MPGLSLAGTAVAGGIRNVAGNAFATGNVSRKEIIVNFGAGAAANFVGNIASKVTGNLAEKTFSKLPRHVRKAKLAKIYSNKGSMRNANFETARLDSSFGEKLSPIRGFIYSTLSLEAVGRIANRRLRQFAY